MSTIGEKGEAQVVRSRYIEYMAAGEGHLSIENLRAFALRDRREVALLKQQHWAEQYRRGGPALAVHLGRELYQHALCVRPEFPTQQAREDDFQDHVALKLKLDRVAFAFSIR